MVKQRSSTGDAEEVKWLFVIQSALTSALCSSERIRS
jgi:hypothetical protein